MADNDTRTARIAAVATGAKMMAIGLPAIPVSVFVLREKRLPWLWDLFPMYGGGPFEGNSSATRLVAALMLLLAGTLPFEAVFWWVCAPRARRGWPAPPRPALDGEVTTDRDSCCHRPVSIPLATTTNDGAYAARRSA